MSFLIQHILKPKYTKLHGNTSLHIVLSRVKTQKETILTKRQRILPRARVASSSRRQSRVMIVQLEYLCTYLPVFDMYSIRDWHNCNSRRVQFTLNSLYILRIRFTTDACQKKFKVLFLFCHLSNKSDRSQDKKNQA